MNSADELRRPLELVDLNAAPVLLELDVLRVSESSPPSGRRRDELHVEGDAAPLLQVHALEGRVREVAVVGGGPHRESRRRRLRGGWRRRPRGLLALLHLRAADRLLAADGAASLVRRVGGEEGGALVRIASLGARSRADHAEGPRELQGPGGLLAASPVGDGQPPRVGAGALGDPGEELGLLLQQDQAVDVGDHEAPPEDEAYPLTLEHAFHLLALELGVQDLGRGIHLFPHVAASGVDDLPAGVTRGPLVM
mmetsp:Transcript_19787/g.59313  ORF Transcript_19787/g.59313 Transcript_19787/m.59313 type:complete len:253 (+) Transcript_19787:1124-1882(+)